jgi:thioredoxin-like negative regulator of GroEL
MTNYKEGTELPKTGNVLLFAGAPWCSPCKTLKPTVELALEGFNATSYYIDLDEHYVLANTLGISSVPTLIVIKNGWQS